MSFEQLVQLTQAVGVPFAILLFMALYVWDRGRADSKNETALAGIASNATAQFTDVMRQMGDLQKAIGKSEGKVEVLQDTLTRERMEWDKQRKELLERIDNLEKERDDLRNRIRQIEEQKAKQIEILISERDGLKSDVAERDKRVIAQEIRINELLETVGDLEKEIAQLKAETNQQKEPEKVKTDEQA